MLTQSSGPNGLHLFVMIMTRNIKLPSELNTVLDIGRSHIFPITKAIHHFLLYNSFPVLMVSQNISL